MKNYNIRLEGNPYVSLLGAIIDLARYDAEHARTDADRKDAEKGISEWLVKAEISVSMAGSDCYLNDRQHGVRL